MKPPPDDTIKSGVVILFTVLGALIGHIVDYNIYMNSNYAERGGGHYAVVIDGQNTIHRIIGGASIGAVIGMLVDLYLTTRRCAKK